MIVVIFLALSVVSALNGSNTTQTNNSDVPSPSFANQTYAPSPSFVNQTYAPSPSFANQTYAPSPSLVNPAPSFANQTYAPSPSLENPAPSFANQTYAPSPSLANPSPSSANASPSFLNPSPSQSPSFPVHSPSTKPSPCSKHVRNEVKGPTASSGLLYLMFALGFLLALMGGWCIKMKWGELWATDKHSFHEIEQTEELELSGLDSAQKTII